MGSRDEARHRAVEARSRAADGSFVFAVATTGVYCRPSCPSRRALRTNVRFFEAPAAAELAGFRACKRCDPRGLERSPSEALVAAACRMLDAQPPPPLAELAARLGYSPFHVHRTFREATGLTPRAWAAQARAERARAALARGEAVVTAQAAAGYGSSSRLHAATRGALGMSPSAFRRGGEGAELRVTTASCRLGRVLVATTTRGVAAVLLGDDDDALLRDLVTRFPKAELVAPDRALVRLLPAIVAAVDGHGGAPASRVPLDLRGTAFQRRVWDALARLPASATTTYAELARALGLPGGARAVARACATNPVAVLVPCHRVVRADGALAGYAWGLERKRALLERESARARAR